MGQVQSDVAAVVDKGEQFPPAELPHAQATPPSPSMESLFAGASSLSLYMNLHLCDKNFS